MKIKRAYLRHYRDSDDMKAYVEWASGGRTEGDAEVYHGIMVPTDEHMGALFDRALREGITIEREVW